MAFKQTNAAHMSWKPTIGWIAFAAALVLASSAPAQTPPSTPESLEAATTAAPVADATAPTVETLTAGETLTEGQTPAEQQAAVEGQEPYAGPTEPSVPTTTPDATPDALEAARIKLWTSPQMVEARQYVEEYGRRSVQFNSQAAEQYLAKLRASSPTEMQAWLERYTARRAGKIRSEAVARAARQTAVDQTLSRLQAVRRSYENFNQGQSAGALTAQQQLLTQHQMAGERSAAKQANRSLQLESMYATNYSWIINPPLWVKQAAAASSAPGDLPAGDPRNFMRGDIPAPGDPAVGGAGAAGAAAAAAGAGAAAAGAGAGGAP